MYGDRVARPGMLGGAGQGKHEDVRCGMLEQTQAACLPRTQIGPCSTTADPPQMSTRQQPAVDQTACGWMAHAQQTPHESREAGARRSSCFRRQTHLSLTFQLMRTSYVCPGRNRSSVVHVLLALVYLPEHAAQPRFGQPLCPPRRAKHHCHVRHNMGGPQRTIGTSESGGSCRWQCPCWTPRRISAQPASPVSRGRQRPHQRAPARR